MAAPAAGDGLIVRPLSVVVVAVALTAAACGGSGGAANGGGPIRIVGVTGNASDPFWISLRCGAEAAARRAGVELSWSASTTADATVLAQNLKTETLKRPDGVVLAPFASSAFVSPVRRLMRDGVPVAVVGGATFDEPVHYQAFRTSPRISFASLAALAAEQVPGAGKLGILGGLPGIDLEAVRVDPFVAALARANPALEPLPVEYEAFDSTKAATIVSAWIIAHPDLKAIWAVSGPAAQGAVAAVQQRGLTGRVRIYAYDATPVEVAALKRGVISALVAQSPRAQGEQAVEALVGYLRRRSGRGPVPAGRPQSVDVESLLLTPANVDSPEGRRFVYRTKC